jgi:prepilin-type N-terminal cleavage/methylation domain-containing protein
MNDKKNIKIGQGGFTLIELSVSAVIAAIVILGLAVVFISSQRAYEVTYDKVNADVITDGYCARALFDAVVRKSASASIAVGKDGLSAQLSYYRDNDSEQLDRYAKFYTADRQLKVEYGTIDETGAKEAREVSTICSNVSGCLFRNLGTSVVMVLTLDDGTQSNTIVTSAYAHN